MVAPAVVLGAKVVVGKIAEQIAIQAAAELLLRRILPGRGGAAVPVDNPIADLETSALMQQLATILQGGGVGGVGGVGTAAPKRKKVNKYNRLLKAEMKKLKHGRMKPQARFKLAAKRASRALKLSKNKAKRR